MATTPSFSHFSFFSRRYFIAVIAVSAWLCAACRESALPSSHPQLDAIQAAVDARDYPLALARLDDAKLYARTSADIQNITYNQALVDIYANHCEDARQILKTWIDDASETDAPCIDPEQSSFSSHCQISAPLLEWYKAYAIALICPTSDAGSLSPDNATTALGYLYALAEHQPQLRNRIAQIYERMTPACASFIDPKRQSNHAPERALDIDTLQARHAFTLCASHDVWFSFQAQAHESLSIHVDMKQLPRAFHVDDSSLLPYTQLHIDVYLTSPDQTLTLVESIDQQLPTAPPEKKDFERIQRTFNLSAFQTSGDYLIRMRPKDNGEAYVTLTFEKEYDCAWIDDPVTYSTAQTPNLVDLSPDHPLPDALILCPTRPDYYRFSLPPDGYGLVAVSSKDPAFQEDNFRLTLAEDDHPPLAFSSDTAQESASERFRYFFIEASDDTPSSPTAYLLVHNTQRTDANYRLSAESLRAPIPYHVSLSVSSPCSEDTTATQSELDLSQMNDETAIALPPRWICEKSAHRLRPLLPASSPSLNARSDTIFMAVQQTNANDFNVSARITQPPDMHEWIAETASLHPLSAKRAPYPLYAYRLQKPLLHNTLFLFQTQSSAGFMQMTLSVPPPSDEQNTSDEQQKQEQKQQDPNKQEKNPSPDKNKQNESPEKPSETPATPQGAGTDTKGNESTPDETNDGDNQAHQFDPKQLERDHIDALLDEIERGNANIPLPGNLNNAPLEKDW